VTDLNRLAVAMQALLTTTADQLARECGFVRRQRKVSGSNFAQALVFVALADPQPTENRLRNTAAVVGLNASRQAIAKRFDDRAARFLLQLLAVAVNQAVASPVAIPLLRRFSAVVVLDSSVVPLLAALAETYRGGHSRTTTGPTAAVKLTVGLDLVSGTLLGPELSAGRAGDLAAPLAQAEPPPGGLHLADLNYFSLEKFARWGRAGAFWLSRLKCKTAVYNDQGCRLDLVAWLRDAGKADVDQDVVLGGGKHRVACRLIARRVPAEVAALRRQRLRDKSAERGDQVSPVALALCDWTVLVTNVPREKLNVEEAVALARMRWQIELLFKLWKSGGGIDRWRGAKTASALCQLYSKLLAQVVRHWVIVVGAWSLSDRSVTKAAEVVQMLALSLAMAMGSLSRLSAVLRHARQLMEIGARMERRRKSPNAHDMILCLDPGP
jgi:Transposase DDE domain